MAKAPNLSARVFQRAAPWLVSVREQVRGDLGDGPTATELSRDEIKQRLSLGQHVAASPEALDVMEQ